MSRINRTGLQRVLSIVLVVAMLVGLCPAVLATEIAEKVANVTAPDGRVLISQSNYSLTNGVTESQIILNNPAGNSQVLGYMATIEPGADAKIMASYSGYYTPGSTPESRAEAAQSLKWDLKTTTAQAAAYEAATGETVIAAVNGDYYNMQTGQTLGYLIMEGNVIQTGGKNQDGNICQYPYFARLKDGTYAIRPYGTPTDDVLEAISGPFYLIQNGNIVASASDTWVAPRNSVGIKADGSVVLLVADGRQGLSDGMTLYELAQVLKSAGCVDALYLDGGGSATYASRHEGTDALVIQSHPSDGPERVIADSLLVVSTATQTGIFDHASISPANDVHMAGSTIQFTADGVDAGGYPAQMPTGLTWEVDNDALGTIDASGRFTSNGTCGKLTVNLKDGNTIVGSASVELQEPDELYIPADSMNLAFKATTDFDLTVRYENRTLVLNDYAFNWSITPLDPSLTADQIGSFEGNLFTSVKAKQTLNCEISVFYTKADGTILSDSITVEIGKMPQIIYDFEPDENGKISRGVAQYDWGKSGIAQYMPATDPLTYFAWDDATNAPGMITNSGPFTFDGKYIERDPAAQDKCYYPATSIFKADGYDFMTDHTGVMQTGSAAGDIVTAEDGQVRFGEHALRWDFDYRVLNPGYKNVNMWLYSTEDMILEGTPTGVGMWVYAPEDTANFWLWLCMWYYKDGAYQREWIHFTTQEGRSIQYNGIYWDGWMYIEADISHLAQYASEEHPLMVGEGQYWLNLTFIPGGSADENGGKIPMGSFSNGSIYIDNVRAVYGDTIDDMENPVISGVAVNGTAVTEDGTTVIADNEVTIATAFMDPVSDNATGINTAKTAIYVDGLRQTLTASTESGAVASLVLPNGTHSVTVSVCDGFGNVTKTTRYFTVNDSTSAFGTVALSGEDAAVLNETYTLELKSEGSDAIGEVTAEIRLTNTFGDPTVAFPEGCTGEYQLDNNVLKLKVTQSTPAAGVLATITFDISPATAQGTVFTYSIDAGTYQDGTNSLTFSQPAQTVGVAAPYSICADIMTVGGNGKIYVTKADGSSPGRVKIYAVQEGAEDVLLGTTNSSGVLVTNRYCQTVGETFTIYASGAEGLSFRYNGTTTGLGSDEVAPTNVRLNAVADPTTTQSISWFSAPQYTEKKAIVEYVDKAAYDSGEYEFKAVSGTCTTASFVSDNQSSQINNVNLSGLTPDTTYCYRVGDGVDGHWSDVSEFTTAASLEDTTFFIMGDTQLSGNAEADASDLEDMRAMAALINDEDVEFGVHTGDFIDDAGSLAGWNEILGLFSEEYATLPVIQTMGNHEYYGNTSGSIGETVFDLADKNYYSVEYGNVYVAVINCNAKLEDAAAWLIEDAAKTDCEWKVVTVHQSPYYSNPKGSSAAYHEYLPAAMDAAGIDFVFSGHDHSYARTEPMIGGEVNEEGTVYMICGDLGEKSRDVNYTPNNNPDFHFAKLTQDYDALYLIANTVGNDMTVTAYNLDGSVIDTYTKHHTTECEVNGHDYVYDRAADTVSCTVCGEVFTDYTGWATDPELNGELYFLAGSYKTGWFAIGFDLYHFDEQTGISHELTVLEDVPTTCGEQGYMTVSCECGETYTLEYEEPTGHHYYEATAEDGSIYYVCSGCGNISSMNLPFADVNDDDWFAEAVNYVYQNEYFNGVNSMSFAPNDAMNRAMLVVVLWRIAGSPGYENVQTVPYSDCRTNFWYTAAINWAAETGIVTGYTDGNFRPTQAITREQMVTVLHRFAKYMEMDVTATADLSTYIDADDIHDYALEAFSWAVAEGLINGVGENRLAPAGTATRAQVATIIMRFQEMTDADATEPEPVPNPDPALPEDDEEEPEETPNEEDDPGNGN